MKQNDKFEADLLRVEKILDRAKTDLMNLLPEFESSDPSVAGKNGTGAPSAAVMDVPLPGETGKVAHVHRWFDFVFHKS